MAISCPYPAWSPPVSIPLTVIPDHACPYFTDRRATLRAFASRQLNPRTYEQFMDAGFRRSGNIFYQPICRGCRLCLPIRISVADFHPGKTQRRRLRQNQDLRVETQPPTPSKEKFALYRRYLQQWHHSIEPPVYQEFITFLYASPVNTIEMTYRDPGGRLLAAGICDVGPTYLSSVYFYFEPEQAGRSLGVFGALTELEYARTARLEWYYMGYWVKGCHSMEYKADYHPYQILHPDGHWRWGNN